MKKHILIGTLAAISLLLLYATVLVLLQGTEHLLEQTTRLWYWLLVLDVGFGIQIGLFSFLRQGLKKRQTRTTAGVATSGGISAGAMVACCAHHLTEVLPLIGASGLTAFLTNYQVFFMIVGILSNIIGITIMMDTIQRLGLCPILARMKWKMGLVKKVTLVSAIFITPVVFLIFK
jgi:hypothetical protein